ncbi:MAG: DNA polymerase clamp loader subunit A [bacterium]
MKLFDYLNALTLKDKEVNFDNPEDRNEYKPYIINRFVSMSEVFIPVVNEINRYEIPKEAHYTYLDSIIPKRKQYFKYIKASKDLTLEEKKYVAMYFEVGLKDAERYIKILSKDQIDEIINVYTYGKNNSSRV